MGIPKEELSSVDRLSKIIDCDDWRTAKPFFEILNNLWGLLTIDRFADQDLVQNSLSFVYKGLNAFTFHWSNEMNYLVLPVFRKGVLVVSYWPSAVLWPLIFNTNNIYKLFIKDTKIFYNSQETITQGNNKKMLDRLRQVQSLNCSFKD